VGNKCDLEQKRQVSYNQAKEFADKHGIKFLETSAKDTLNIDELFSSIAEKLLEKQTTLTGKNEKKTKGQGNVVNIQNTPTAQNQPKDSGCC
jgi:GTPase SAR1 family protein